MKNKINDYKITTSIYFDKRRPSAKNTFPVRLRVTFQREVKYYSTGISLTNDEYEIIFNPKPKQKTPQNLKDIHTNLIVKEERAKLIIDSLSNFSFELFEKRFIEKPLTKDVFLFIEKEMNELTNKNRLGTMETYKNTLKSLQSFHNKPKLDFEEITPKFLNDYQKHMLNCGKSLTTIGIYLRTLRAVFNNAISENLINIELYPFGKKKYIIPNTEKSKESLNLDEISKIFNYECSTIYEQSAKDLFVFSYLCNGINIVDILKLKYNQLSENKIIFIREKTKLTTQSNQKELQINLTNELKTIILPIIERQGTEQKPENYIFRYITKEMNDIQIHAKVKGVTKLTNKHLKNICTKVGINKNISTYTARHSFASMMINKGASIHFLKEKLGHKDSKTTEVYIHSVGIDTDLINSLIPK